MYAWRPIFVRGLMRDLLEREDGQVAIAFAIALIPLISTVGAAVDYSRANNIQAQLQSTMDSAVLAGAKDGTSNWASTALNTFNSNISPQGSTVATPSFSANNNVYSGTVTASVPTTFLGIVGKSSIPVSVTSVATAGGNPDNSCILTLDAGKPLSDVSMTFNGAPNISLSGCSIRSNTSLTCNGNSGSAFASIAGGTASGCTNPQSNAGVVPDIYAALAGNITTKCGSLTVGATWVPGTPPSPPSLVTVNVGNYTEYHICGDLTVSGNGYLTGSSPSSDSIIVIENGSLTVADNAKISTMRTAIVLTGNNQYASSINFPNGKGHAATLSLSPPTSTGDPWQGVALYQNPSLTNSVDDTWGSGATFDADGLVYLPNANVTISGNSGSANAQCTKIVTKTFTTNGSSDLNFLQTSSGCSSLGLKQWAGITVHLAQ